MKQFKQAFTYIILPILLAFVIIAGFFVYAVVYPKNTFYSSYQSVIQDKYDGLINDNGKKIILVGGSNLAFGIDEYMLSEATGYSVHNLGLHASMGGVFDTELAKANIGEGDIVLLGYEYIWKDDWYFSSLVSVDLVMSGIDSRWDMYRHIPVRCLPEIIGYLPTFCEKKATYVPVDGIYSRDSFDENGNMSLEREFMMDDFDVNAYEYGGWVSLYGITISQQSIDYLNDLKEYVESRGAQVYFIAPVLYKKAQGSGDETFIAFPPLVEEKTGIRYISNPLDYLFGDEYMFDKIYHCNELGAEYRTQILISDLQNAGIC